MPDDQLTCPAPTSALSKFIEGQPLHVQAGLNAYRVAIRERGDWHRAVVAAIEASAAPDLLDALKGLIDFIEIDKLPVDRDALFIARRAIAKAEGTDIHAG